MFLVAGAAPELPMRVIGPGATVGLLALSAGLLFGSFPAVWLGAVLGLASAAVFVITIAGFFRRRLVRRLEPTFGHVLVAFSGLVLALAVGIAQLVLPGTSARAWVMYGELTLLGWLVIFITGIWYRLFAFLIWLHFYGRAGTRVRQAAELVHHRTAWAALGLLTGG
jgi:drug/metabolite transporter (DMT)-like permease